jgi:hypothetical protein
VKQIGSRDECGSQVGVSDRSGACVAPASFAVSHIGSPASPYVVITVRKVDLRLPVIVSAMSLVGPDRNETR